MWVVCPPRWTDPDNNGILGLVFTFCVIYIFFSFFFHSLSNAWPPLQEIIVTGLENTGEAKALEIAKQLVKKWIKNVYVSYEQSQKKMFEKYDVEQVKLKTFK